MLAPSEEMLPNGNFLQWHQRAERLGVLEHFLTLAHRGRNSAASGGEQRAYRLSKAIEADAAGMDAEAVAGLIEFVRIAASRPSTAKDLCPA